MEPWNTRAFFEAAAVSDVARCLQSGADLAALGASGWTPLHYAASVGIPEIVTVLLEAGPTWRRALKTAGPRCMRCGWEP